MQPLCLEKQNGQAVNQRWPIKRAPSSCVPRTVAGTVCVCVRGWATRAFGVDKWLEKEERCGSSKCRLAWRRQSALTAGRKALCAGATRLGGETGRHHGKAIRLRRSVFGCGRWDQARHTPRPNGSRVGQPPIDPTLGGLGAPARELHSHACVFQKMSQFFQKKIKGQVLCSSDMHCPKRMKKVMDPQSAGTLILRAKSWVCVCDVLCTTPISKKKTFTYWPSHL